MPAKFINYYDVLGVPRDASEADVKKAFRDLARKYHPDVAKDKTAGEQKFKAINEANEVLSDPGRRKTYDELMESREHPERQSSRRRTYEGFGGDSRDGAGFHFEGTGFSDFFEQFFGSRGQSSWAPEHGRGAGMGGTPFAQRGQDVEGDILVTLEEALHGSKRTITLQRTDPITGQSTSQALHAKIPPGVREGQLIRLAGKGQDGIGGGEAGNLYLRVRLANHPDFRTRGANLYRDLDLAPWEAVLGATIHMPTLDGTASLKVPAGTVAGRQFRLRGKGLPNGAGTRGDLHVVVSIQTPATVTPEQLAIWKQLAEASTFNPRQHS